MPEYNNLFSVLWIIIGYFIIAFLLYRGALLKALFAFLVFIVGGHKLGLTITWVTGLLLLLLWYLNYKLWIWLEARKEKRASRIFHVANIARMDFETAKELALKSIVDSQFDTQKPVGDNNAPGFLGRGIRGFFSDHYGLVRSKQFSFHVDVRNLEPFDLRDDQSAAYRLGRAKTSDGWAHVCVREGDDRVLEVYALPDAPYREVLIHPSVPVAS